MRPALASNAMLQNDGPVAGCRRALDIIGALRVARQGVTNDTVPDCERDMRWKNLELEETSETLIA